MLLSSKTVGVGVTGGIAAYKTCTLVSLLVKAGADVRVVMTRNATQFVTPLTFETLSKNRVTVDTFDRNFEYEVGHVSLAKKADLFLVAPCTANMLAKISCGICDDFLSTTLTAFSGPVLLCPAMNTGMLYALSTQANLKLLSERGYHILEPDAGRLACGDNGAGRLPEPEVIFEKAVELLCPKTDYAGKTVLVTAGATEEPIDPVRFITNRSSGKMGIALAEHALRRGAKVILVAGKTTEKLPESCETLRVSTTKEMRDAVMSRLPECDYVIKAAAPSDYRVAEHAPQKIKSKELELKLVKNPDIAAEVGANKGKTKLVVFAAETENLIDNARKKLKTKNADMVVANDVTADGAGFNVDTNIVTLITDGTEKPLECMKKSILADVILDELLKL